MDLIIKRRFSDFPLPDSPLEGTSCHAATKKDSNNVFAYLRTIHWLSSSYGSKRFERHGEAALPFGRTYLGKKQHTFGGQHPTSKKGICEG